MSNQIIVANALSLQMVNLPCTITANEVSIPEVRGILTANEGKWITAVGHPDTAVVMSNELKIPVLANRINVHLNQGDTLIVCQVMGGRLPEGATTLPEGITLKWIKVTVD